jgi:hypothetical protein
MDEESGPKLDLRLPCWDNGRRDNRRTQEPLEDTESRGSSAIGLEVTSPCRRNECLLLFDFGDERWTLPKGRGAPPELVGCEIRGPGLTSMISRKEE